MSHARKACLDQLRIESRCDVVFITIDTLKDYIVDPLHPAYQYLSDTQKGDYLKAYFMHFYGGGYADIKRTTGSWVKAFDEFNNSEAWISGYQEVGSHGVAYPPVREYWKDLVGNCAYICKPRTPLTQEWYSSMLELLDSKLDALKQHPAKHPQDHAETGSGYPIEWNELNGRIFHRVCYKYKDKILKSVPTPIFNNYR